LNETIVNQHHFVGVVKVVSKVNIENNQAVLTVEALEIFRGENLKEIIDNFPINWLKNCIKQAYEPI